MHPLERLASAMARQEGFWAPGPTPPKTNNNPGNMRRGFVQRLPGVGGFVKFKSPEEGFANLFANLAVFAARDLTLRQAITIWAPPGGADGGNNTELYIKNVCAWTGYVPETHLQSLVSVSKDL